MIGTDTGGFILPHLEDFKITLPDETALKMFIQLICFRRNTPGVLPLRRFYQHERQDAYLLMYHLDPLIPEVIIKPPIPQAIFNNV